MNAHKILIFLLLWSCCAAAKGANLIDAAAEFERSVRSHAQAELTTTQLKQKVVEAFTESNLSSVLENLDVLTVTERDALFRALKQKSFYLSRASDAIAIEKVGLTLLSDSSRRASIVRDVYGELVAARQFERAMSWRDRNKQVDVGSLPSFVDKLPDDRAPSLWVAQRKNVLERVNAEHTDQLMLVAVVSLNCGFSRAALTQLAARDEFTQKVKGRALWIVPGERSLDFERIAKWNGDNPSLQLSLVHKEQDWTFVDDWSTPTFYIMHEGKVVDRVVGWPRDGSNEAILVNAISKVRGKVSR